MDANVCFKDENGNYTDPITHEIIEKGRLVKFKQSNILYCFDYLTLYKYKEHSGEYLNPYNRQPLSESVIKKVEELVDKYSHNIIIYFYDITSNTSDEKEIVLFEQEINTVEKLFDLIIDKTEETIDVEDMLVCNIRVVVDDEEIDIYNTNKFKLGNNNEIYVNPTNDRSLFLDRFNFFNNNLSSRYRNYLDPLKTFIHNIKNEINYMKSKIETTYYIQGIGRYNYTELNNIFKSIGWKSFYLLNEEFIDFLISMQFVSAVAFCIDAMHYGMNKDIVVDVLKSNSSGLKILLFSNNIYTNYIYKYLSNNKKLVTHELLQYMLIYLNGKIINSSIGYLTANLLTKKKFIVFLIKKDYYDIIIQLMKTFNSKNIKIIEMIKTYSNQNSKTYKYLIEQNYYI